MVKRKGKSVRKNKQTSMLEEEESKAPHSFVIHRGKVGKFVQELVKDFRQVMEPYTASNIKVRPKNVVKDFVQVAGMLKVSHLCMFTKTDLGPYFKVARFPRGPTLSFKVQEYVLGRDVRSSLKRQVTHEKQYLDHPLLVMNNFPSEKREFQLAASMFQNMFPTINVAKVKLGTIRRCVLLNFNKETGLVDFRHYAIKVVPVGINRGIKKIVLSKVPNLGRLEQMEDLLTNGGAVSESEGEDDEMSKVVIPQEMTVRGAVPAQQSSVRLVELGPRMSLELIKIEEGFMDGEVMFHQYIQKTEEEAKAIRERRAERTKQREKRRKEQERNVKKKQEERLKLKEKSMKGMMKPEKPTAQERNAVKSWEGEKSSKDMSDSENDEDWYRKEVGQQPSKDLFSKRNPSKSQHPTNRSQTPNKSQQPGKFQPPGRAGKSRSPNVKRKNFHANDDDNRARKGPMKGKAKRKMKVFNSDGVGPNFKKGSSSLRGVKGGKVQKAGGKKTSRHK